MKLRSRINEMFTPEFLDELYDLFRQHKFYVKGKDGKEERVQDVRHFKTLTFRKKLFDYFEEKEVSFSFLGDGTNRMAFLVDGYVFKLALDDQGYIDNLTEFKMSREAQPYVTKTYETNGLFCVAEYVTLISYDEFVKQKARILEILDILSSEYLLGDMGWTKKNYCNWGYRKNTKDLVILDYGHMLPMDQNKMICSECGGFLHYNSTFTKIQCISCGKEHDFINIKQKISKREEIEMLDRYFNESIKTTEKSVEIQDEVKRPKKKYVEEDDEMVSTRFIDFQPKKHGGRRRLSDIFEDSNWDNEEEDDDTITDADWYNASLIIERGRAKAKERKEAKKYESLEEYRIAQIIDDDNWLFYLVGMVATDEITDKEFNRYKRIIEERRAERDKEDGEELSTIGEVVKTKDKKSNKRSLTKLLEEDSKEEEDPYLVLLRDLGGTCFEDEENEEPKKVKEEITEQEAELMEELIEMDDDIEGGMRPEDFIAEKGEELGYNDEDEEDDENSDRILSRIKRVTNEQLKLMEDEMFDDEEDEVPTLEVVEPEVEESVNIVEDTPTLEVVEPEVETDTTVMKLDEPNNNNTIYSKTILENEKVNDNVFKVQRKNESVEMKVDGDNIQEPDNIISVQESQSPEYKKVVDDADIKIEVKEVEKITDMRYTGENNFPSQEEMMNAISNAIKQTHEMNKYDHYEEEYEHLYDEEDNMRNKGKNTKGWK